MALTWRGETAALSREQLDAFRQGDAPQQGGQPLFLRLSVVVFRFCSGPRNPPGTRSTTFFGLNSANTLYET